MTSSGSGISDDLQLEFHLDVVRMTDALQEAVARHPAGLVDVRAWLTRV